MNDARRLALFGGVVAGLAVVLSASPARAEDDRAHDATEATEARDAFVRDQQKLMTVLGAYALGSISTGIPMMTSSSEEVRAAGVQNVAWGAVDGAIALYALALALARERSPSPAKESAAHWTGERAKLRTLFAVNAGLDVLYITAGALLLALGQTDGVRGTGGGILAPGGFLFAFDTAGFFVMAPNR